MRYLIILIIVLNIIACGIEHNVKNNPAQLENCPNCILEAEDSPSQPVNAVEE